MFAPEDKALLKKLKRRTLLDLALTLPQSYTDTTLSKSLKEGTVTVKAEVLSSTMVQGKLRLEFYLTDFKTKATALFFRTTPYHKATFQPGSKHIITGRLNYFRGMLQINQPKVLKHSGVVVPKYKTVLKESEIGGLIKRYITQETLSAAGLYENEVTALLNLHFPSSLDLIFYKGELKQEIVSALKSVEIYNHLIKLKRKRTFSEALKPLCAKSDAFIKKLPFRLTRDQEDVIATIQADLAQAKKATKRLIIGDVGSGKTIVILAAAMMASKDKSILMAPTSLLANQLFEEAQKYLKEFLDIALVTQKSTRGDYTQADFIIGTHALLYKEDLPKAALIMIDEQHRFGANQRSMLNAMVKQEGKSAHFLQFSATPIPRTQAMVESELVDISTITMLPFKKELETSIIGRADFSNLLEHIKAEIEQEHQVLIVYPLVEASDEIPYTPLTKALHFWQKRFSGVYVTHGRDREKESVLLDFRENGNILLATTVIEVGISLPRLTTIIIVGAERFGLATLHQLRGRVGRYGIKSHCFLYTNFKTPPKRLVEFCNTLDGFEIARLDLKYRNSGDMLDGVTQSGKSFHWLDLSEDEAVIKDAKQRVASLRI